MKKIKFKVASTTSAACCTPKSVVRPAKSEHEQLAASHPHLPVAIIGAGPIGLAAAAHLAERGLKFILFEAGSDVGNNIREWKHVRLFSPWEYNIDRAAERLLLKEGWYSPVGTDLPLGEELVHHYLEPLASLPELKPYIHFSSKVISIARKHTDKMKSNQREHAPFVIYVDRQGCTERHEVRAVIDATGTWGNPNPLHADGIWTREERALHSHIYYGIPNFETDLPRYLGKRIVVAGSGHSALNTLLDAVKLREMDANTEIIWLMRKKSVNEAYGGEENDQLEARGALGSQVHKYIDHGLIQVVTPFMVEELAEMDSKIQIIGASNEGRQIIEGIDEIIVTTGNRPDFSFLSELRIGIDPVTESVQGIAPLIDPNVHSCGTVRPHGERELRHQEQNLYIVGMKSYGRAPTFLMATGYEQVRSIAAYLAGDMESARNVELKLPETGVCSINTTAKGSACC